MTHVDKTDWTEQVGRSYHPSLVIPQIFSPQECQKIISLSDAYPLQPGVVWNGAEFVEEPHRRRMLTSHLERTPDAAWIHERMDIVFAKTADYWGFDVRETVEPLKYLVYHPGDHFSQWHIDVGDGYASRRKLTMSIELSPPHEYEGGRVELFPGREQADADTAPLAAGTATIFPSYWYHRVTPVTRGVRRAILNWVSGPPFR